MDFKQLIKLTLLYLCSGKILRLPDCGKLDAAWTKFYYGKKLKGCLYSIISEATFQDCAIKCALYPKCESISMNDHERLCMLHHSRHNESGITFETAEGWTHIETDNEIQNLGPFCATHKPCQKGQQCEDTCHSPQYKCKFRENKWILQATDMCFGAKNDSYGKFTISHNGRLVSLKFRHKRGTVTCNNEDSIVGSRWGCWKFPKTIYISITTDKNQTVISKDVVNETNFKYNLPGFDGNSPVLIITGYNQTVQTGEELRVWYNQDLKDHSEENNDGISCADVYAVFSD
ncbi:uncharacterized protein LOC130614803 [Hydractinia symbiolongicarpus]|uniref:uncharacterized protein LOC130614803 n=1 Tax=Hydractinia symbiolongicarpus TaxID=13093 RepID=UPI00254CD898|nr:uncharacterized protein LOC130614803 [Hydractinia symbiolongicarpus]